MIVSIVKMQTVELSGLSSLTSAVYSLESLSTVSHTQTSILTARNSPEYRPECSAKESLIQDAYHRTSLPGPTKKR